MMTDTIMRVNMVEKISNVQRVYRLQKEQENGSGYRHAAEAVTSAKKQKAPNKSENEETVSMEFSKLLEEEYMRQRYASLLQEDSGAEDKNLKNLESGLGHPSTKARLLSAAAAYEANFMYL